MANVKCPKCGNLISGGQAGQMVKCSKCGYSMKFLLLRMHTFLMLVQHHMGARMTIYHLQHGNWYQEFYLWFCLFLFLFSHVPQV